MAATSGIQEAVRGAASSQALGASPNGDSSLLAQPGLLSWDLPTERVNFSLADGCETLQVSVPRDWLSPVLLKSLSYESWSPGKCF